MKVETNYLTFTNYSCIILVSNKFLMILINPLQPGVSIPPFTAFSIPLENIRKSLGGIEK